MKHGFTWAINFLDYMETSNLYQTAEEAIESAKTNAKEFPWETISIDEIENDYGFCTIINCIKPAENVAFWDGKKWIAR